MATRMRGDRGVDMRSKAWAFGLLFSALNATGCSGCGEVETTGSGTTTASTTTTGGETTTTTPTCPTCEPLSPGLVGAYLSVASSGDELWAAGYLEKAMTDWGSLYYWGDLVVGRVDGEKVSWEIVDGLPDDEVVDPELHDPAGFRGGLVEPGDDVGTWASIALDEAGSPVVAYHDRTNRALKLARRTGSGWTVHTVDSVPDGEAGRYAKLVIAGGAIQVAYLFAEPLAGDVTRSGVRLATATSKEPGEGDWTFEDVVSSENPSPSKAVFNAYPKLVGTYVAAAADGGSGLGLVYHDGVRGNLVAARKKGGAWESVVLDGEENGEDTGNVGVGASLFIDGDTWHVAYKDQDRKALRYLRIEGGSVAERALVDTGARAKGETFAGQHAVGDDTSILVAAGGKVHVSYQDATAGVLRHAIGTPGAGGTTWEIEPLPEERFGGWFSKLVLHDGALRVASWSRARGTTLEGDVSVITP